MDMDFNTVRGPRSAPTETVPYTLTADFSDNYPESPGRRTFHSVVRVQADLADKFLQSILPDVKADTQLVSQVLNLSPFGVEENEEKRYYRQRLTRYDPLEHPLHPRAYAAEAQVIGGDGYPGVENNWLMFKRRGSDEAGYVRIGITFRDQPYVTVVEDDEIHAPDGSEILRFCQFRCVPRGQSIPTKGQVAYYVDDDGEMIRTGGGSTPFMPVPEGLPIYFPSIEFEVIWRMVPRVPLAAFLLQNTVNMYRDFKVPASLLPYDASPDVGTILYKSYSPSDIYYTVSGQEVYDITYRFLYRPGGAEIQRGHNSAFCPKNGIRDMRRIVYASLAGGGTLDPVFQLPISTGNDEARWTKVGHNSHNFAQHANLFRLEAGPA
jgi:hypothetical protein